MWLLERIMVYCIKEIQINWINFFSEFSFLPFSKNHFLEETFFVCCKEYYGIYIWLECISCLVISMSRQMVWRFSEVVWQGNFPSWGDPGYISWGHKLSIFRRQFCTTTRGFEAPFSIFSHFQGPHKIEKPHKIA